MRRGGALQPEQGLENWETMPRILIKCPNLGTVVPTGRRTPALDLATLATPLSFRCPACEAVHSWTAADVEVEQTISLSTMRSRAA